MSVLDQGCELEGRLAFSGTLVLNGRFNGELLSSDTLIVGEDADLKADVQVGVAIVSGQLFGHITARERVELRSTARMYGDIVTPVLVLEEGVIFDGHCKMKGDELEAVNQRR
ncbi:MAG: hypothetical protein GTO40_30085 [Deltaproteobacteria bacterium]|nr:hypothetical protein [Deltaproteobacteria bacterium]